MKRFLRRAVAASTITELPAALPKPRPAQGVVRFYNFQPEGNAFLDEVLAGMAQAPKSLPSRYFYDKCGAQLYEKVMEQPENLSAQSELALLRAHARAITEFLGADCQLVEFGAASARRTRILLQELQPPLYVVFDTNAEATQVAAERLAQWFPALNLVGVCADYTRTLTLPEFIGVPIRRKAVYLPGSLLNRFAAQEAAAVLRNARRNVGVGGALLLGIDPMDRGKAALEANCNDAAGAMAAFNLNLLARINRELGADFQLRRFAHHASYDALRGQVEMRLVSLASQFAHIGGVRLRFAPDEAICTEISRRLSGEEIHALARACGFEPGAIWCGSDNLFVLHGMLAV